MGVLNRSPRISPEADIQFEEWTIPKGVRVPYILSQKSSFSHTSILCTLLTLLFNPNLDSRLHVKLPHAPRPQHLSRPQHFRSRALDDRRLGALEAHAQALRPLCSRIPGLPRSEVSFLKHLLNFERLGLRSRQLASHP